MALCLLGMSGGLVSRLLFSVPSKYKAGLDVVVLPNQSGAPGAGAWEKLRRGRDGCLRIVSWADIILRTRADPLGSSYM